VDAAGTPLTKPKGPEVAGLPASKYGAATLCGGGGQGYALILRAPGV
jgi:acetyl-CoA acetyltransferase